jgi:hypothetical protein
MEKIASKANKENIKVAIRVRPPLPREIQGNEFKNCVAFG